MTINAITFDRMRVTPGDDSLVYQEIIGDSDQILTTYGDRLKTTTSGLNVYVSSGAAIIRGRLVRISDLESITVTANSSGYICITIDLTKVNTSTGTPGSGDYVASNNQVRLEAVSTLVKQDLHNGGKIYTFPIAKYTANGATVTLTDEQANADHKLNLIAAADINPSPAGDTALTTNVAVGTYAGTDFESVGNGTIKCLVSGVYRIQVLATMSPVTAAAMLNSYRRIGMTWKRGTAAVPDSNLISAGTYNAGPVIADGFIPLQVGDIGYINTVGGAQHLGLSGIRGYLERL